MCRALRERRPSPPITPTCFSILWSIAVPPNRALVMRLSSSRSLGWKRRMIMLEKTLQSAFSSGGRLSGFIEARAQPLRGLAHAAQLLKSFIDGRRLAEVGGETAIRVQCNALRGND